MSFAFDGGAVICAEGEATKGKWRACRERAFGMAIMLDEFVRRDAG